MITNMIIKNTITNSNPLVAHAQGHVHFTDKWKDIVETLPLVNKETLPGDITIVSFFAIEEDMSLKKQLDASGIPVVNAVNRELKYWNNPAKIKMLSELKIETKYTFCLDGLDVLLAEDLSDLLNRFNTFNAKIVYNASKLNYPHICKDKENTKSPFGFLNAGAFLGETLAIKDFYNYLMRKEMYKDYGRFDNSEQIRVRKGRQFYEFGSEIVVDTECLIFQTLNQSEFDYSDNILKITK